jgi:hypothetical protein
MSERPILFNGEMVRAILEGRKTMTRRVIKPQPEIRVNGPYHAHTEGKYSVMFETKPDVNGEGGGKRSYYLSPYGIPGDQLWVRETWHNGPAGLLYKATPPMAIYPKSWKPSIHMLRTASRITLEIVSVRVERVQDISEEDAKAEGIKVIGSIMGHTLTGRELYKGLWDSINEKRGFGWGTNPWVFVINFKQINAIQTLTSGL